MGRTDAERAKATMEIQANNVIEAMQKWTRDLLDRHQQCVNQIAQIERERDDARAAAIHFFHCVHCRQGSFCVEGERYVRRLGLLAEKTNVSATATRNGRPGIRFKERVRQLREERGWKSNMLAVYAGIHRGHLHHIETGGRDPSIATASRIAAAFGMTLSELFVGVDQSQDETPDPDGE